MAKTTTKKAANAGVQQQQTLRELSQANAAWLLGMHPRSLRDHPDSPRNSDGSYDGPALVAWAIRRGQGAELGEEQRELLEIAGDEVYGALAEIPAPAVAARLAALHDEHGEPLLRELGEVVLSRVALLAQRYPPDGHANPYAELKLATVCETCGKLRRGRQWVKARPPQGYVVEKRYCPEHQ